MVFIHSTLDQISQSLNKVSQSLRPHQSCPLHRVYFSLSYRGTQVHSRTGVAITYSWPQYARARMLITRAPAAQWLSSRLTRAVMGHMIIEECLTRPRDISEFLSLHERRQEVLITVHSTSTSTTPCTLGRCRAPCLFLQSRARNTCKLFTPLLHRHLMYVYDSEPSVLLGYDFKSFYSVSNLLTARSRWICDATGLKHLFGEEHVVDY